MSDDPKPITRPTGKNAKVVGVLFIVVGVVANFAPAFLALSGFGAASIESIGTRGLVVFGRGLIDLGVTIWLAGYIVSAIYFIPGRND